MKTKKKILMFSYSFPPIKGIGTLRNYNIANQFQKHFEVKILSTKNRFILPLEDINVDEFDISYLRTFDYKTVKGKSHLNASKRNKRTKWNLFIRKLINSFPFNLLFGEGGLFYIIHGLFLSIKLGKKGYNNIYSSYSPISDHFIAYISKLFNNKRVWIADYRDLPYHGENQNFLFVKFQIYILNKIINKADYVLTISEGLKSFFKEHNENVIVLRSGISNLIKSDFNKVTELNKFTITYTGALYNGKRDPKILFSVLEKLIQEGSIKLSDINLVYAGLEGDLWETIAKKNNLKDAVTNLGMLPIQEALTLQQNTHINLLLTWCTPKQKGILTGKLSEYINAKKHIIVLINGQNDLELEGIIKDLHIGKVFYNENEEELKEWFLKKYVEWKKEGEITTSINPIAYKNHSWDYQFNDFLNKITIK